jgi:hypothetical protein
MYQHTDFIWLFNIYIYILVFCAAFLWSVPIDKARVDVLDRIKNLLGQFIIWHALTNAEGYVLWCIRARSMSVVANENNDVTLFWEVNCKMRLFAMKYSIEFEEKINQYNSLLYRKKSKVTNTYVHGLCGADDQL